jgi:hypothetical protein
MTEFVAEETACLEMTGSQNRMGVIFSRSRDLSSLMHDLDIFGVVDNHDPDVHCEH